MRDKENEKRWRNKTYKHYHIILKRNGEQDIIEVLDKQPSKAQYIVRLIREDIKKNSK